MPYTIEPRPKLGSGLSREEEKELGRRILDGDPDSARAARHRLAEANMAICVHMARVFRNREIDRDDLIGEGYIGLTRAANAWDPARGARFGTLAYRFVRNQVVEAIRDRSTTIRVPVWARKLRQARREAIREGRPTELDDADRKTLWLADQAMAMSRESEVGISDGLPYLESVARDRPSVELEFERRDLLESIRRRIDRLDDRTRSVVLSRCGLDGEMTMTLRKLGEKLRLSEERVRQIEARGIRELRAAYREWEV